MNTTASWGWFWWTFLAVFVGQMFLWPPGVNIFGSFETGTIYAWGPGPNVRDIGPFPPGTQIKQSGNVLATVNDQTITFHGYPATSHLQYEVALYYQAPWYEDKQFDTIHVGTFELMTEGRVAFTKYGTATRLSGQAALNEFATCYGEAYAARNTHERQVRLNHYRKMVKQLEAQE